MQIFLEMNILADRNWNWGKKKLHIHGLVEALCRQMEHDEMKNTDG
jgi:hypothetical protein